MEDTTAVTVTVLAALKELIDEYQEAYTMEVQKLTPFSYTAVYNTMRALLKEGWIKLVRQGGGSGRPRKYYTWAPTGRREITTEPLATQIVQVSLRS